MDDRVCASLGGGISREDNHHSGRDASMDANGRAIEQPLQSREAAEALGSEKRRVPVLVKPSEGEKRTVRRR